VSVIGPSGPGNAGATLLDPNIGLKELAGQVQAGTIDPSKLMAELLKALEVTEGAGNKNVDGRQGPPGAPGLEPPSTDFSADQLSIILATLNNKTADAQMKTAKQGLEISKAQKEEMHQKAMEKLEEAAKKAAEAADKSVGAKILAWFGKIAAFLAAVVAVVAAAVATAASVGAGAPLLALAVMGLVATGMDLANHISQSMTPPGPEISIGKLMTDFATVILTDVCGMSKEEAQKMAPILACVMATIVSPGAAAILAPDLYGNAAAAIAVAAGMNPDDAKWLAMAITLAVTLVVAVAMVVATGGGSAAKLGGDVAKVGGEAAKAAANTAKQIGAITQAVGQGVSGATNIAQGAIKIDAAHSTRDAELARASKKEFDKMIMVLGKQMEEEKERIKELLENLDQAMTMVSQMIASAGDTRLQQVKNIV
jgi:hypothetical protein